MLEPARALSAMFALFVIYALTAITADHSFADLAPVGFNVPGFSAPAIKNEAPGSSAAARLAP